MNAAQVLGSAGQMTGVIVIDLIATVAVFAAIVRVVNLPKERWPHGRMSKTAWVVAIVWFTWMVGHVLVPLGAIAALWRENSLRRQEPAQPDGIPTAAGSPVSKNDVR